MSVMDRQCKRWVKLVASLLDTDRDLTRDLIQLEKKKHLALAAEGGWMVLHQVLFFGTRGDWNGLSALAVEC